MLIKSAQSSAEKVHTALQTPVLKYSSETVILKVKVK
jgi:hypothetical protein